MYDSLSKVAADSPFGNFVKFRDIVVARKQPRKMFVQAHTEIKGKSQLFSVPVSIAFKYVTLLKHDESKLVVFLESEFSKQILLVCLSLICSRRVGLQQADLPRPSSKNKIKKLKPNSSI